MDPSLLGSTSTPVPVPVSNSRPVTPATVRLAATARNWDSFGMLLGVITSAKDTTCGSKAKDAKYFFMIPLIGNQHKKPADVLYRKLRAGD